MRRPVANERVGSDDQTRGCRRERQQLSADNDGSRRRRGRRERNGRVDIDVSGCEVKAVATEMKCGAQPECSNHVLGSRCSSSAARTTLGSLPSVGGEVVGQSTGDLQTQRVHKISHLAEEIGLRVKRWTNLAPRFMASMVSAGILWL